MYIRLATQEDIPAICSLSGELFARMAALEPDIFKQGEQSTAFVQSCFSNAKRDILVAEADGRVVGHAIVEQRETPDYPCMVPHRFVHLMDLVVTEVWRGRGVGTQLMAAVKEWAAARGADYVSLEVVAANRDAARFYDMHGFRAVQHTMHAAPSDNNKG